MQETRSAFQIAMQHKFIAAIERLSGREVLAFISNQHVGPDIEIELFMLKLRAARDGRRDVSSGVALAPATSANVTIRRRSSS